MTITSDPGVLKKAKYRVFIENGAIVIEDDNKKRHGGNLLTNGGKKIQWHNETGGSCTLSFFDFLPDDASGDGARAWPFAPDQNPWSNSVTLPASDVPDQNPWTGTLKSAGDLACYEYKVKVVMPDGKSYEIDPIIIVRP
jgi:hypothetical protein